jgi:hypothetical protein
MKLVTSSEDHPPVTLKLVPTLAEMVKSLLTNNATTEEELVLNPTTEPSLINAERDVFYLSVVMELLISAKNVILEPAMV